MTFTVIEVQGKGKYEVVVNAALTGFKHLKLLGSEVSVRRKIVSNEHCFK